MQEDDRLFKVPSISGGGGGYRNYAILRIGKRFHTFIDIKCYENHSERKVDVLNADKGKSKDNRILIGNSDVVETVKDYLKDVGKIRSNNVLATEILLTASPRYFKKMLPQDKEKWIQKNIKWLQNKYGNNIVYLSCHEDETTCHLSGIIVSKFWDEKRKTFILANKRNFGGATALANLQDEYGKVMSSVGLIRGTRWSKAKHVAIQHYYALVNSKLDMNSLESICVKAKQGELLQNAVIGLQKTLEVYKTINKQTEQQRIDLLKDMNKLTHDKAIFKEAVKTMSKLYKIDRKTILSVLTSANENLNRSNDKERGK